MYIYIHTQQHTLMQISVERSAQLVYECGEHEKDTVIQEVIEEPTCVYTIRIATPLLCRRHVDKKVSIIHTYTYVLMYV